LISPSTCTERSNLYIHQSSLRPSLPHSLLLLLSLSLYYSHPEISRDSDEKYVIATCSIAIVLSFFTLCSYLINTDKLVGGLLEATVGTMVFALWCGAQSLIQNPNNNLAIEMDEFFVTHRIRNTNLYFFSWTAFLSSAYVLTSIVQQYRLVDVTNFPSNLVRWYLFLISSVVVFGTSSKLKPLTCGPDDTSTSGGRVIDFDFDFGNRDLSLLCRTTKYAICLGVVSAGLALIPIIWSHLAKMNIIVEMIVSVIVTVFYCVGAAYVTDSSGPGSNVGNLYFSTWFGFGLAILLTFSCIKELVAPEHLVEESQHPSEVRKPAAESGGGGDGEGEGEGNEGKSSEPHHHEGQEEQL